MRSEYLKKLLLTAVLSAESVSAGVVRRAPLGVSALVNELSNVNGRNFCVGYIGAEVFYLPDLTTYSAVRTISKLVNVKTTTTEEEIIGTLRKGTSTTTQTLTTLDTTVIGGEPTTTWTTEYVTEYSTATTTATVTSFYPTFALRRRQGPPTEDDEPEETWVPGVPESSWWGTEVPPTPSMATEEGPPTPSMATEEGEPIATPTPSMLLPPAIADSDPLSISAACTRVVNKYPIYATRSETTTKTLSTTTATETNLSTVTRTKKVTHTDPYAIHTTTIIYVGTITSTADGALTTETTSVPTYLPTTVTATTTINQCAWAALPSASMIGGILPVKNTFEDAVSVHQIMATQSECCTFCHTTAAENGWGCIGYQFTANFYQYEDHQGFCMIAYRLQNSGVGEPGAKCPVKRIGLYWNDAMEYGRPSQWRPGPCLQTLFECDINDPNVCFQRWIDQGA